MWSSVLEGPAEAEGQLTSTHEMHQTFSESPQEVV